MAEKTEPWRLTGTYKVPGVTIDIRRLIGRVDTHCRQPRRSGRRSLCGNGPRAGRMARLGPSRTSSRPPTWAMARCSS